MAKTPRKQCRTPATFDGIEFLGLANIILIFGNLNPLTASRSWAGVAPVSLMSSPYSF